MHAVGVCGGGGGRSHSLRQLRSRLRRRRISLPQQLPGPLDGQRDVGATIHPRLRASIQCHSAVTAAQDAQDAVSSLTACIKHDLPTSWRHGSLQLRNAPIEAWEPVTELGGGEIRGGAGVVVLYHGGEVGMEGGGLQGAGRQLHPHIVAELQQAGLGPRVRCRYRRHRRAHEPRHGPEVVCGAGAAASLQWNSGRSPGEAIGKYSGWDGERCGVLYIIHIEPRQ